MFGTYVGNGRVLINTTFGAKLLAASDDLSLMPDLVVSGGYDVPFTNYVRRTLSSGMVGIDVGANIGLFTMLMAWQVGPTGRVLAYECEPRNFGLLRENVGLNYATWVELHDQAVGAAPGTATLHRTSRYRGNASIVGHDEAYAEHFAGIDTFDELSVPVVALDGLDGRFERIDLIKVDAEGAEMQVLQGMRELLHSGTVDRLSVEIVRDRMPRDDWEPLVAELRGLMQRGWTFATIADDGGTQPLTLERLVEHAWFSQVLMQAPART